MRGYIEATFGAWPEVLTRAELVNAAQLGAFNKVFVDGICVGAFGMEYHTTHIQIEQMFIEPAHQNKGIGSELVRGIVAQAVKRDKPVRLKVLVGNPAKRFYERMGFAVTESTKVRYFMEFKVTPTLH